MSHLAIVTEPPKPPPNRGRMLNSRQVAKEKFHGTVSEKWVRENLGYRIELGTQTVRWFEYDVDRWIEERRQSI